MAFYCFEKDPNAFRWSLLTLCVQGHILPLVDDDVPLCACVRVGVCLGVFFGLCVCLCVYVCGFAHLAMRFLLWIAVRVPLDVYILVWEFLLLRLGVHSCVWVHLGVFGRVCRCFRLF